MRKVLVGGGALAMVMTAIVLWFSHSSTPVAGSAEDPRFADDVVQLNTEQRISQLENELQALKEQYSRQSEPRKSTREARRPSHATAGNEGARREKFKSGLSTSFASQPIDRTWARETRAGLEQALVMTAAEQIDFPAPETIQVHCRSVTCRIEASYPDEDSAFYGVQLLQSAFSARLPRTHQYSRSNPDGSVTIVMYASKGSA